MSELSFWSCNQSVPSGCHSLTYANCRVSQGLQDLMVSPVYQEIQENRDHLGILRTLG